MSALAADRDYELARADTFLSAGLALLESLDGLPHPTDGVIDQIVALRACVECAHAAIATARGSSCSGIG